jgi:hypothetical protein
MSDEQAARSARLYDAAERFEAAKAERDELIWQCHLAGIPYREIADDADLCRDTAYRMIQARKRAEARTLRAPTKENP